MPDWLAPVLAVPGLGWMVFTIAAAGVVRGFTGFGTALIFVPVAGQFLPPADVILLITLTGVGSTVALLPRAWKDADKAEDAENADKAETLQGMTLSWVTCWMSWVFTPPASLP